MFLVGVSQLIPLISLQVLLACDAGRRRDLLASPDHAGPVEVAMFAPNKSDTLDRHPLWSWNRHIARACI